MKEIREETIDTSSMLLGDNEFETSSITIPAGKTVKAGTCLARTDDKFAVSELGSGSALSRIAAIATCDIENKGSAEADFPCRVLISGKVRADKLNYNGAEMVPAQLDRCRLAGIIPIKVSDLSKV